MSKSWGRHWARTPSHPVQISWGRAGKILIKLCNIRFDADGPPLGCCYDTKVPTSALMHDVIAAIVYRVLDPDELPSFHRSNRPSASQWVLSSSARLSLQGKGTDSGPQPNDWGRSTQHSRRQPAGRPRWGLAEHLATERRPQTALWTECKNLGRKGQWKRRLFVF